MRHLLSFLTIALLALAPVAAAQEEDKPEDDLSRPDDAAWVEDCPPDMMCAYGGEEPADGDEPTYGECDGEVCAYGPEDCIECSGPPVDEGSTCMDGADANETCHPQRDDCVASGSSADACGDDVQYLDGGGDPTRGPADGSCENCRGEDAEPISAPAETVGDARADVPGPALGAAILALGAVALVAARRR